MRELDLVKKVVLEHLEGEDAGVWLFGSHAVGSANRTSDIDVGILPRSPVSRWKLQGLRQALEDLNIPYTVDLVMLDEVSVSFRETVLRDAVQWSN